MKMLAIYPVPEGGGDIRMPKDAKIVGVDVVEGILSIFAVIDKASLHVLRRIEIAGIGGKVTDGYKPIKVLTFAASGHTFIMGVFDGGESAAPAIQIVPNGASPRPM